MGGSGVTHVGGSTKAGADAPAFRGSGRGRKLAQPPPMVSVIAPLRGQAVRPAVALYLSPESGVPVSWHKRDTCCRGSGPAAGTPGGEVWPGAGAAR